MSECSAQSARLLLIRRENILFEKATATGLHGEAYPEVNIALKTALGKASGEDLILVCGSVFVVGEVLPVHT